MRKCVLIAITLLVAGWLPAVEPSLLNESLTAYYPLDRSAEDASGNGNNGVEYGVVPFIPGAQGQAAKLDGVFYMQAPSADHLNVFPLTVTAWIYMSDIDLNGRWVVGKYENWSGNGYVMYLKNGMLGAWYYSDPNNYVSFESHEYGPLDYPGWNHVAFVVDEDSGRMYVNGTLVETRTWVGSSGSPTTSAEPLQIGSFLGNIDEVRIYNRALSATEITEVATCVYWLEIAANNAGSLNSRWRTDAVARNIGVAQASVWFVLHTDAEEIEITASISPASQSAFEDIVGTMGHTGKGSLEIRSDQPLRVIGRIYNQAAVGTFGQFLDGCTTTDGLRQGESAWLLGLRQVATQFRTNLSFTNTGVEAASLEVKLYRDDGIEIHRYTRNLQPGSVFQDVEPFRVRANQADLGWGFAEVGVISGTGILTSASVIDAITGDATTIPMKQ